MGSEIFHCGALGAGHAIKALNNYLGAAGTIAGFEALLVGETFGLDPKTMIDVINASTGNNSTTERKIPQQVLTKAFASGFSLALMTKDVGIAEGTRTFARRWKRPYLKQTLKVWRAALSRLPAGADHTEMYRYLKKLRSPSRAAASPRATFASKATSLHLSGWPAATGRSIFQPCARPSGRQPCASDASAGISRPTTV